MYMFMSKKERRLSSTIRRDLQPVIMDSVLKKNAVKIQPFVVSIVNLISMFHMTNDSHLFRTKKQLESKGYLLRNNIFSIDENKYLLLYEAKMIHQFDHVLSVSMHK